MDSVLWAFALFFFAPFFVACFSDCFAALLRVFLFLGVEDSLSVLLLLLLVTLARAVARCAFRFGRFAASGLEGALTSALVE